MRKSAVALVLVLLASFGAIAPTPAAAAEPKVVIIVGATHGATEKYRQNADRAYAEAIKYTSNVVKVYSPNATWARVKAAVSGARSSSTWATATAGRAPTRYDPKYTTKNGFGLNKVEGAGDNNNVYYGEPYVSTLDLAPGAVVMLHHLCYAAGNSEPGQAEPSVTVARQRADNYAAGFLKAGAAAVIADGHAGPEGYLQALFTTQQPLESHVGQPVERERKHRLVPIGSDAGRHRLPGSRDPDVGLLPLDRRPLGGRASSASRPPGGTVDTSVQLTAGTGYGATASGLFSAPTKTTTVGKYLTWQFSGGPAMAGKRVEIWARDPGRHRPWSAFTNRTARIADASGNAYFYLRSSSRDVGLGSRVLPRRRDDGRPLVARAPRAVSLTGEARPPNPTRPHQTHPYYPRAGPSADGSI